MLQKIENLSNELLGVKAEGTVTRHDYESVLIPLLRERHLAGKHVRFLYQFGPEFKEFSPGAALSDFWVGIKYLRLFERCAIVTDIEWIRKASALFGSMFPCPVELFPNNHLQNAIDWLASADAESKLKIAFRQNGVVVAYPEGPLRREDFEKLSSTIDPLIEKHNGFKGLVISFPKFPGWENLGSLIRHIDFVRGHHQKVRKVALAVDGKFPELVSQFASHFVKAEIKQFPHKEEEEAVHWVAN